MLGEHGEEGLLAAYSGLIPLKITTSLSPSSG